LAGGTLLAQTPNRFTFAQYDTVVSGSEDHYILAGAILNTSPDTLTLTAIRHTLAQPEGWTVSMCVNFCLPPFMDEYTFTMYPGDSAFFSLDIYPNAIAGSGHWQIFVVDSTTMETDSAEFSLDFQPVAVKFVPARPAAIKLLGWGPNPTNGALLLRLDIPTAGLGTIAVFDLRGRQLFTQRRWFQAGKTALLLDMPQLAAGTYLLRLRQNDLVRSLTFVVAP